LTVTAARERVVDFTQPFYMTGLGVAVSMDEGRWRSIFRALVSFGFFHAVLTLLAIAMCVGFLVWLLERRKTEHFSGGAKGLASGFWWSAIAMTQAGAAQNAPATLPDASSPWAG
jgi:polar amino acid transport system substrate-binding protein